MSEERIPEAWAWEKPVAGGTWMTDVRIGWGKPSPDATKFNLRPLYSDPDGAEKEITTLRAQLAAAQADAIRAYKNLSAVFTHWMEDANPDELPDVVESARDTLCDLTMTRPINPAMRGKEGE